MLYLNQVLNEIKKDEFFLTSSRFLYPNCRHRDIHGVPHIIIIHICTKCIDIMIWYVWSPFSFLCYFISFWAFQESNPPKALRAEHLFKLNEVCRENCEEISLKSDTREDKVTKRTRWQGDKVTSEGEKEEEQNKRKKHGLKDPLPSFTILYDAVRCFKATPKLRQTEERWNTTMNMKIYEYV